MPKDQVSHFKVPEPLSKREEVKRAYRAIVAEENAAKVIKLLKQISAYPRRH
jgi:hypothetical protein